MKNVMVNMAKDALTYQPEVFICSEADIIHGVEHDKERYQEEKKRANREYMKNKYGKSLCNDLQKGYMDELFD